MALLKDLIVYGASRFLADAFGTNIYADKHITNGGTATQFLKGDGTLDSNTYATTSSLESYLPLSAGSTKALTGCLYINSNSLGATPHISFNRASWNYIYIPSNGALAICNNVSAGGANSIFVADSANSNVSPGYKANAIDLGTSTYYWKNVYAAKFIKNGGTSSQFLKADGSVDSNTYLTSANLTTHAKFADTATAGQVLVSKATNTYEWKTLPTVYDTKVNLASNTGTTTQAFTLNSSADRTMTVKGDGTYLTGAVSGSANSVTVTINHIANTTAGTAGQSGASTGVTFNIPYVTYNAGGHITAGGTHEHSITGAQIATILSGQTVGTLTVNNLTVPKTLLIPAHDPSATSSTDTAYLWLGTGAYSETPGGGGGGGDVYDLTLRKNSVSLGTYNLGTSAADINIPINWSDLTPDSTHRFLTDALIDKWDRAYGELIIGTHTTDTNAWTGNSILPTATAMTSGYRFTYWLPRRGSGNATLTLTFQDNTTKTINLYFRGAGRLTTHFAAGSKIDFAYIENALVGATAYTGAWPDSNYEDGNNSAYQLISYYIRTYIYSNSTPLYRYKIYGYRNGRIVPIVVTNQENGTQVNKVPASVALDTKQGLWYYNATTNITSDSTVSPGSTSAYMKTVATTGCSYTFNETVPAYCDVYLQGSYDPTTGLFTLDNTQTSGNYRSYYVFALKSSISNYNSAFTSGKYYWYVGPTYSSANYLQLAVDNPVYYFNGTSLIPAATGVAGDFLPLSGGTMTGDIVMSNGSMLVASDLDQTIIYDDAQGNVGDDLIYLSSSIPTQNENAQGSVYIGNSYRDLIFYTPGGLYDESNKRSIYHKLYLQTQGGSGQVSSYKLWDASNFNPKHYLNNKAGTNHPIYGSLYLDMRVKRNKTDLENRAINAITGPWDGSSTTRVYEMIRQETDGNLVIGHGAYNNGGITTILGDSISIMTAGNGTPMSINAGGDSINFNEEMLINVSEVKASYLCAKNANVYNTCSTGAATAAKTVTLSHYGTPITNATAWLDVGTRITVKFTYANTANTPTLSVAVGSTTTGAKNIFHRGAQITTGANKALLAGVCDFVYDGTQWHLIGNYYDSTYSVYNTAINLASNTGTATQAFTLNSSSARTVTISGDGTYITGAVSGSANAATVTLSHATTITAGTVGTSSATSGKTLAIPYVTYNAAGHITATGTHTHTISGLTLDDVADGSTRKLSDYVPTTRTINSKALSSNITLSLDDIADGSTRKLSNYLPLTGGTLTGDVTTTADIHFTTTNRDGRLRFQSSASGSNVAYNLAVMQGGTSPALLLGYGNNQSSKTVPTYLDGYDIYTRFGASNAYAFVLDHSGVIKSSANITPASNGGSSLGTSAVRWSNLYTAGIDSSGDITTAGDITTTANIYIDNSAANKSIYYKDSGGSWIRGLLFLNNGNITLGYDGPGHGLATYIDGLNIYLRYGSTKDSQIVLEGSTGTITGVKTVLSATTDTYNLGSTTNRWAGVYAGILDASEALVVPQVAPTSPVYGNYYLYINPDGNYVE